MPASRTPSPFKAGDKVRLNTKGSPTMMVHNASTMAGDVHCQWFAGKKLESGLFHPDSLVAVLDDDDGD